MSRLEAARTELEAVRTEVERLQAENVKLQSKCQALEETCDTVHAQVSWARQEGELERFRAVESERSKWESHEARLVAQLQAAEERVGLPSLPHTQGTQSESTAEVPNPTRSLVAEVTTHPRLMEPAVQGSPSSAAVQGSPNSAAAQGSPSSGRPMLFTDYVLPPNVLATPF